MTDALRFMLAGPVEPGHRRGRSSMISPTSDDLERCARCNRRYQARSFGMILVGDRITFAETTVA